MAIRAFDVYGTLLDVHSAVMRHADALGPQAGRLAELWRTKQLEYTWVLNGLGRYEPFDALTEQALDHAVGVVGGVTGDLRDRLLEAYGSLDAYGDVLPALERWRSAGDTILVFSNANPAMLEQALASSHLGLLIDRIVSVDEARVFKPDPRSYALLDPWRTQGLTFYSSNRWDVAGARSVGLAAVWVNRRGAPDEYVALAPIMTVADLMEAADKGG